MFILGRHLTMGFRLTYTFRIGGAVNARRHNFMSETMASQEAKLVGGPGGGGSILLNGFSLHYLHEGKTLDGNTSSSLYDCAVAALEGASSDTQAAPPPQQVQPPSQTKIQELLTLGSIWYLPNTPPVRGPPSIRLTNSSAHKTKPSPQDRLRIHPTPRRFSLPPNVTFQNLISYREDEIGLLVIEKPSAVPCHGTVDNNSENVVAWGREYLGEDSYVGLPARLDIDTSGLLILSTSIEFQRYFTKLIRDNTDAHATAQLMEPTDSKKIRKEYRALVHGSPSDFAAVLKRIADGNNSADDGVNILTHYLLNTIGVPKQFVPHSSFSESPDCINGQLAKLRVKSFRQGKLKNTTEVSVELLTGRTHQIRGQLSEIGFPIVNDVVYGGVRGSDGGTGDSRMCLVCASITFKKPTVREVTEERKIKAYDKKQQRVFFRTESKVVRKYEESDEWVVLVGAGGWW